MYPRVDHTANGPCFIGPEIVPLTQPWELTSKDDLDCYWSGLLRSVR